MPFFPLCCILTIDVLKKNLPNKVVNALKELAKCHHRSMEMEVRTIISNYVMDRITAMKRIEALWKENRRKISPDEAEELCRKSREWQR